MSEATRSSITVAAPPADVMAVIADFPAYPEWADAVKEADVLATQEDGRAAQVRFVLDAGAIRDTYTLGYTWDDDTAVRWGLVEAGSMLKAMDGSYDLAPADGGTEVTYTLTVDVSIPMIGMFKRKAEKVITDTALKELKRRVEG
jgi:ribosome-associated toxin RatA of RatAB toxin-antitoxin module